MERNILFREICEEEMYLVEGGCGFCTVGSVLGGAATLGSVAFGLSFGTPVIVGAAIVGGCIGYLTTL